MKSLSRIAVTIFAIITSFAGVSMAQTFTRSDGSTITVYSSEFQKSDQLQASWTDTAQKSYLAQLVVGGGTGYAGGFRLLNGYETAIRFDNNCDKPAAADVEWILDGSFFQLKTQLELSSHDLFDTVAGAGVLSGRSTWETVLTLPQTAVKTGFVRVLNQTFGSQGQTCITVSSVIRHKTNGTIDAQAAVFPMIPANAFSFHVRLTKMSNTPPYDDVETGAAFTNPSKTETAVVTLTIFDDIGRQVGTPTSITILPMGQLARFASEFFPVLLRENGFEGSIEVSSTLPIAALVLENSGFNFSAGVIGPARPVLTP